MVEDQKFIQVSVFFGLLLFQITYSYFTKYYLFQLYVLIILFFMTRLKKLTIDGIDESQQEIVEQFIHSQPLESLEYYGRSNRIPLESFLQQLNSSLKHLKLSIPKDLVVTRFLHEKLTSSTLKSCHLDIDGKVSVQDLDALSSYLSAEQRPATLPSLTISIINRKNSASVLQSFPNLHHLKISYLSSKTLQSLLKYQVRIFYFRLLFLEIKFRKYILVEIEIFRIQKAAENQN